MNATVQPEPLHAGSARSARAARAARADVPEPSTWDLSDLFVDHAAWAAGCPRVDEACVQMAALRSQIQDGPSLCQALQAMEALEVQLVRVATHAHLRNAEDSTDPDRQAALAQASALRARVATEVALMESALLALPEAQLSAWREATPGLADYGRWMDERLAQRPHRWGAEAEQVVAALSEVLNAPALIYQRAKLADMRFAPFTDAAGTEYANSINGFESQYDLHSDPSVRHAAWASFTEGLRAHQHTCAATLATETQKQVVLARLRGFPDAESSLLHAHQIPRAVYRQMLALLQETLSPHMQRLARLRGRVLGLEQLHLCDLRAPLETAADQPAVSYEQACTWILEAVAVMGPEYQAFIRRALAERWVDRADNIGKSSGAFCSSPYGVHPYILITWGNTLRNAFTLAHELGHAGHFGLAMRHQRYLDTRPALPFIEAPSTLNEMLLAQHLLSRSSDVRWRRTVILQLLGTYHHNFVTHGLEAELQRQLYAQAEQGQAVTAARLNACKGAILQGFWGDTLRVDDGARMTWMRQPHYYMGLYPYTYAVGLVASTAVSLQIQQQGAPAVGRWLEALKAGGTRPPLALYAMAGVDFSTEQPVREAVAYVGRLVDELASLFP